MVHELAHTWVRHNLTDSDRERFRLSVGAPTWGSHEHAWEARATEIAAETIVWALLDPRPTLRLPYGTCAELAATFADLTGALPLQVADACEVRVGDRIVTAGRPERA